MARPSLATSGGGGTGATLTQILVHSLVRLLSLILILIGAILVYGGIKLMLLGGSLPWDLLNESQLEVSYGVYLYHVEAPGVGETTGTFAIIK